MLFAAAADPAADAADAARGLTTDTGSLMVLFSVGEGVVTAAVLDWLKGATT